MESAQGKRCIKCGYERKEIELAPETECPKCGVIYERVEAKARLAQLPPIDMKTPRGKAIQAREAGRTLFQTEIALSDSTGHSSFLFGTFTRTGATADAAATLEAIEGEGWNLVNAGYVFRPTETAGRENIIGTTEREAISGQVIGIYLFRRRSGDDPS